MKSIAMKNLCITLFLSSFILLFNCSKENDSENEPNINPVADDPIVDDPSPDDPDTDDPSEPEPEEVQLYFPPIGSTEWETLSMEELSWNATAEQPLLDYLVEKDTKAFLIIKNGKIVMEEYFGNTTINSNQTWNSAGKTLISMTVGIAQHEGFISLTNPSSTYLGEGWSSLTPAQENGISVRNHLTMTTGLDYDVDNNFCTDMECFIYKNEPDSFWFYHQGAFSMLEQVITNAVGEDYEAYFNQKIKSKIGMQGSFVKLGFSNFYFSNARSMARFGLLHLANGVWNGDPVLADTDYFNAMTTTSQELNPAYGYLYWLNGKDTYRIPDSEESYDGKLVPNAPDDMYAGLGGNDQKMYVVPSQNLVVIRMGNDASDSNLGPSSFDDELWIRINALID